MNKISMLPGHAFFTVQPNGTYAIITNVSGELQRIAKQDVNRFITQMKRRYDVERSEGRSLVPQSAKLTNISLIDGMLTFEYTEQSV